MWTFILLLLLLANGLLAYVNYNSEDYKNAMFDAFICGCLTMAIFAQVLLN